MALFTINRYQGDDELCTVTKESQAAVILEKLNLSAKKKQKKDAKDYLPPVRNESCSKIDSLTQETTTKSPKISTVKSEIQTPESKNRKKYENQSQIESLPKVKLEILTPQSKTRKEYGENQSQIESFSKLDTQAKSAKVKTESLDVSHTLSSKKKRKRKSESITDKQDNEKEYSPDEVCDESATALESDILKSPETVDQRESENKMDTTVTDQPSTFGDDEETTGYTVLGEVRETHLEKLRYKLPDWLARPIVMLSNLRKGGLPLDDVTFLESDIVETLKEDGVERLFPVQEHLVPAILNGCRPSFATGLLGLRPRDLCCSSPTGSGKTLAFALPIVQALKSRLVPRIRALIVLPVRDLAKQVHQVFQKLCRRTDLKVGLVVGLKSLAHEQAALIKTHEEGVHHHSLVDILVATPGRLADHLQKTEGFDLSELRFIVIDEADRVVDDIKQDWLHHVTESINNAHGHNIFTQPLTAANLRKSVIPPQKLLFSATLTQNPEKLQQLNLFQPQLYTSLVQREDDQVPEIVEKTEGDFVGKYTTPAGLTEYFTQCTPQQRPLLVLHYLHNLKLRYILCFTNSKESTHRLATLLRLFGGVEVREFSSKMDASKRAKIIKEFEAGKVHLIVCTDAMARGMDIDNVKYVISYEPPPRIKTYIHRVGRTARAGRAGIAFSLLERREVFSFKKMVKSSGKIDVAEQKLRPSSFKNLLPKYEVALKELPTVLRREMLLKSSQKR